MLRSLGASLRVGEDVVAFDPHKTLTLAQAAKRLRTSHTQFYKLFDCGTGSFHRVGRDRRTLIWSLMHFAAVRDANGEISPSVSQPRSAIVPKRSRRSRIFSNRAATCLLVAP